VNEAQPVPQEIVGADAVARAVGEWPCFHDAEIQRLVLDALDLGHGGPTLLLEVAVDEPCDHVRRRTGAQAATVVEFRFHGVRNLALDSFQAQNVMDGISIRAAPDDQGARVFSVRVAASLGLECTFLCTRAETRVKPT